ncbi:MAG: MarR family transcriptional regulator [Acidobacteriota bacterium]
MEDTQYENKWFQDVPIPALLRHARSTYGIAMRQALEDAGFDDIPGNGLYVIGGLYLSENETPLSELIKELRISKQAAGNLVDALVNRGYLVRTVDNDDRRKLTVHLTERGIAAATTQSEARDDIDSKLLAHVGADDIARTKRTLATLCEIGREAEEKL